MPAVISDTLETRLSLVGLDSYASGFVRAAGAAGLLEGKLDGLAQKQLNIGVAAGTGAAAIAIGLGKAVQAAGRMETMRMAFTTIEGSAAAADNRIRELQQFAAKTPFDFEGSVKAAQQLRAMGVEGSKLIPLMTAAGNATSAAGGDTEAFQGVLRALGQIQTKGKLSQEELNQLSERGIPAQQILAEELGLTARQLQNIGAAGIPAEQAMDAFVRGANKRFGSAMADQSKTLTGSLSNLTDALNQMGGAIGGPLLGPITSAVQGVSGLIGQFNQLPDAVKGGVGVAAAIIGGVLVVKSGLAFFALHKLVIENQRLQNDSLKAGASARREAADLDALARSANNAANAVGRKNATGGGVMPAGGATAAAVVAGGKGAAKGSRALGALKGVGAAALAAGAADVALSFAPDEGFGGQMKRVGQGVANGAGLGMMIGSVIPGLGTAAGGVIGGLGGGALAAFNEQQPKEPVKPATEDTQIALLQEQNELMRQQLAALKDLPNNLPLGTNDMSGARQVGAFQFGRMVA